MFMEWWPVGIV